MGRAKPSTERIVEFNESMVNLVLGQYMRGVNGTEFSGVFFLSCLFE